MPSGNNAHGNQSWYGSSTGRYRITLEDSREPSSHCKASHDSGMLGRVDEHLPRTTSQLEDRRMSVRTDGDDDIGSTGHRGQPQPSTVPSGTGSERVLADRVRG